MAAADVARAGPLGPGASTLCGFGGVSGRPFLAARLVGPFVLAFPRLQCGSCGLLRPLAELRQSLQFGLELELTVSYLLLQFDVDVVAQLHELVDAKSIQL